MNQELYTKLKYLSVINSAVTCSAAMFRKGKCSQTRLCSQRTATFALAVCYSKHTPIIGIFSPFKNTFRHSEILTHLEKSWQNKCEPKRIKLTCSNVKHPMYNCQGHSRIQQELSSAQNSTFVSCSSLFKQLMACGTRRVRQTRCGDGQNTWQPPEPPLKQVQTCLAEEQGWKMEGHRARSACTFSGWEIKHTLKKSLNCVVLMPWKTLERPAQWQNFPRRALWV